MNPTLGELQNTQEVLSQLVDKPLPISISYRVNKLIKIVQVELDFYRSSFKTILDECAELDEKGGYIPTGNGITIKPDKIDECQRRIEELNAIEVSTDVKLLTMADIDRLDASGLSLTFKEMNSFLIFVA